MDLLPAAPVFLIATLPIAIWVAWSDMATMKIPNTAVIALVAVFAVLGLLALPLPEYLWRYSHLLVVLVAGFVLNLVGALGAGDAKFAAAMALFVPLPDAFPFMMLFAAVLLASFATHRLFRAVPAVRERFPDWQSWTRRDFPMGFALSGTLVFYLGLTTVVGAQAA